MHTGFPLSVVASGAGPSIASTAGTSVKGRAVDLALAQGNCGVVFNVTIYTA
jgi:hypothetical protein